jgi:hypothetical protein
VGEVRGLMILERMKKWLASLRRVEGIELPSMGRSSIESTLANRISAQLSSFGTVSPVIDFEMLRCLKYLWIFNPDLSQYVSNVVNLGNTGHELIIDDADSDMAEHAIGRLNEAATRLYRNGAGVDGLINAYFGQIAWSGALSSEDVISFSARRVERVAIVPVEEIRFVYMHGEYVAHQNAGIVGQRAAAGAQDHPGLIRLNPETYKYFALTTVENSPYAKPPASAAVGAITGPQADMLDNIKWISKKLGILGLVSVMVTPPPRRANETEGEYQLRAQKYLGSVKEALDQNFNKGLLVTFRDQKVEHANVASDASGAYDLWRMNEEQVMSGIAMQPAFFGRTDSTTETYADVVYNLLLAQVSNIQRLVKRRQEATYRLDLLLAGLSSKGISLSFNRAHGRSPLQEAQADQVRLQTAIEKVKAGIISADRAAQELGYDSAFDSSLATGMPNPPTRSKNKKQSKLREQMTFKFDRASQAYKFIPEAAVVVQGPGKVSKPLQS